MMKWMRSAAVACALGAVGCGGVEPELEPAGAVSFVPSIEDGEVLARTEQAVSASQEYYWSQYSSGAVPLGPKWDRVCFLTGVQGRFEGGGESVHVFISGDSWYLGGNSWQTGVAGRARCIPVGGENWYSQEFSWRQGQAPVHLGPASNGRTCFLTRMTGRFYGGGEVVHTYISGDSWYLGGSSAQIEVGASARCVVTTNGTGGEVFWDQTMAGPTYAGDYFNRACFLTLVSGKFGGGTESVRISDTFYSPYQTYWYLGGSSAQFHVNARARCIEDPQLPAACTISNSCSGSTNTVSCTSNVGNCRRGTNQVICDGVVTACPTCTAQTYCPSIDDYISCEGPAGTCSSTSTSVTCNGRRTICPIDDTCGSNPRYCN
jgi:hypothetical protein